MVENIRERIVPLTALKLDTTVVELTVSVFTFMETPVKVDASNVIAVNIGTVKRPVTVKFTVPMVDPRIVDAVIDDAVIEDI